MVATCRQLAILESVMAPLGVHSAPAKEEATLAHRPEGASWVAKNTLVRDVLNEIGNRERPSR